MYGSADGELLYEGLCAIYPQPNSHLLLANLLAVQQEWSGARNSYREVLRRLNNHSRALAGLANVTCLRARENAAQAEVGV